LKTDSENKKGRIELTQMKFLIRQYYSDCRHEFNDGLWSLYLVKERAKSLQWRQRNYF